MQPTGLCRLDSPGCSIILGAMLFACSGRFARGDHANKCWRRALLLKCRCPSGSSIRIPRSHCLCYRTCPHNNNLVAQPPPPRLPAARTTGTRFTDSCHVCCPLSFQVAEEVTGVDDGETAANTVQVTELMAKLKATSGTEASTAIAKELVDMVQALGIQVWTDPMNVLSLLRPRIGILSLLLRLVLSASPRSPSAARDLRPTFHTPLQRHRFRSSLFAVARRRS